MEKEQFAAAEFFKKLLISDGVFMRTNGIGNGIIFWSKAAEHFDDKFIRANRRANNGSNLIEILSNGLGSLHEAAERITKTVNTSLTFVGIFLR